MDDARSSIGSDHFKKPHGSYLAGQTALESGSEIDAADSHESEAAVSNAEAVLRMSNQLPPRMVTGVTKVEKVLGI